MCRTKDYIFGDALHCSVIKFGHVLDLHIANSLLHMYASFGLFSNEVLNLFDEMPERDVVSWNVIIDDLSKNGCFDEVLDAFNEMCRYGVQPNSVTLLVLVSSCLKIGDFGLGKLIHLYIIKRGIDMSENLGNGLIDMYAELGDMESAENFFDGMQTKTVFSWTSLLDGFIQKGELERASTIFGYGFKLWKQPLAEMQAETIFRALPDRDIVSWNTMIIGYSQNKKYMKSLEMLR
ncbi:hypothetical protein RND71_038870 [Anisodus tanguticus]|uniref:Pentatricopeptide repeat-containing protein n=1 Tax=Anisodus tanguticus TaxID=243964 RepID=A0AAE1R1I7_9SOLA|nr:hypothetical protein RND71_038870 [Anisodus tanguticus]